MKIQTVLRFCHGLHLIQPIYENMFPIFWVWSVVSCENWPIFPKCHHLMAQNFFLLEGSWNPHSIRQGLPVQEERLAALLALDHGALGEQALFEKRWVYSHDISFPWNFGILEWHFLNIGKLVCLFVLVFFGGSGVPFGSWDSFLLGSSLASQATAKGRWFEDGAGWEARIGRASRARFVGISNMPEALAILDGEREEGNFWNKKKEGPFFFGQTFWLRGLWIC